MNPEKIIEGLFKELDSAIKTMSKTKTAEEKVIHSQIVKNLCESLGVFLNAAQNAMDTDDYDFDEH